MNFVVDLNRGIFIEMINVKKQGKILYLFLLLVCNNAYSQHSFIIPIGEIRDKQKMLCCNSPTICDTLYRAFYLPEKKTQLELRTNKFGPFQVIKLFQKNDTVFKLLFSINDYVVKNNQLKIIIIFDGDTNVVRESVEYKTGLSENRTPYSIGFIKLNNSNLKYFANKKIKQIEIVDLRIVKIKNVDATRLMNYIQCISRLKRIE